MTMVHMIDVTLSSHVAYVITSLCSNTWRVQTALILIQAVCVITLSLCGKVIR